MIKITITKTREFTAEERTNFILERDRRSMDRNYNDFRGFQFPTEFVAQLLETEITDEQFKAVQKALIETIV